MSIFNELIPKLCEISNSYIKSFNDDLKASFECFDKFEEEYRNGRNRAREKVPKEKMRMTTLQSINEDDVDPENKSEPKNSGAKSNLDSNSSVDSNVEEPRRYSNKRNKNEVDGMASPEQDKRQKRNASVKAQSIISKQVNVNLTQKLRRENSTDKNHKNRKHRDEDKENTEPVLSVQIKQEKVSLPPEPMDMESLPVNIDIKQEPKKDDIAMPPPMAPVPRTRRGKKSQETTSEDTSSGRRTTRSRKQTDTAPVNIQPDPAPRPKRTRGRKKTSDVANAESEKDVAAQSSQESAPASPAAEKPRPKRTKRGKAADKNQEKPTVPEPTISPKEERISHTEIHSPILPHKDKNKSNLTQDKSNSIDQYQTAESIQVQTRVDHTSLDETRVIEKVATEMDKTVIIPNGVYEHNPDTPKDIRKINETVVIEKDIRETIVIEKQVVMNSTIIIEKDAKTTMMTDDNSIMTDDNDEISTTPEKEIIEVLPTSAVKVKVQQFEEMASRVTRTKTRAMTRQDDDTENQTPPDKVSKPVLSAETLNKMNSLIFNGKTPQISSSATKPRVNVVSSVKSLIPSSTSKLSALNKAKEAAEESLKKEKEDARKKKEAILEAKRELQKRKREEKMAAAAAVREAAERERRAVMQAAAIHKQEKLAHATHGKAERLKEAERKKLELARKVAETEERRKAEEQARQQKLAEDQRRADAIRKKQLEEAEAMKKEAAIMAKEIEKKQKEYIEKQKKKHKIENDKVTTPLKTTIPMEPVHMADGFQYLNSDEEEEPAERPIPKWCSSKVRHHQLGVQSLVSTEVVDRLFSVRRHTPDLRRIFPAIDRSRLLRTSSAVWRTPPR